MPLFSHAYYTLFGTYAKSPLSLSSMHRSVSIYSNIAKSMWRWTQRASHQSGFDETRSENLGVSPPFSGSSHILGWQGNSDFFRFTRGRFVSNEEFEMSQRCVHFNMDKLAQIAASTIGSRCCVAIGGCPDGQYAKAFLMTMEDGKQVVVKVPNPNAGPGQLVTASEVATMEFEILMTLFGLKVLIFYRPVTSSRLQSPRFTPGVRKPRATLWGPSTS